MESQLKEILKKKGIGPEGSKSLKSDNLENLADLFKSNDESLTTKATLLTALLLLDPNEDEKKWLDKVKTDPDFYLPMELIPYIKDVPSHTLVGYTKKLINKIELDDVECQTAIELILNPETPEYLKGPFLEGERLKRETSTENRLFFESLWGKSKRIPISTPVLIDLADNYDGNGRTLNLTAFVAALLSSCGFPAICHSIDVVAPKEGITTHQVLKAAGKNPLKSLQDAANDLQDNAIGWGYVDQQMFFPELYKLKRVRKEMVKRPFLATFEKLLQPVQAEKGNYLVTGYTHSHYKTEVINQLANQGQCRKALSIKGAEGSTGVSLSKSTSGMLYDGNKIDEVTFDPSLYGLPALEFKANKDLSPSDSFKEGLDALNNIKNYAYYNIIYSATLISTAFSLLEAEQAVEIFKDALASDKTLSHWTKGSL